MNKIIPYLKKGAVVLGVTLGLIAFSTASYSWVRVCNGYGYCRIVPGGYGYRPYYYRHYYWRGGYHRHWYWHNHYRWHYHYHYHWR